MDKPVGALDTRNHASSAMLLISCRYSFATWNTHCLKFTCWLHILLSNFYMSSILSCFIDTKVSPKDLTSSCGEPCLMKDKGQERRIQYTIGTSSETVNEARLLSCEVTQLHRWAEGRQGGLRQVFLVH